MTTRVAPSPVFKQRPDGNLEVDLPVTVAEAIQGGDIEVPTLNGSKTIRIPPGTQHGTVQRLRGEGPPRTKGAGRGDIHYRIRIDVPEGAHRRAARGGREARRVAQRPRPARVAARRDAARSGAGGRVDGLMADASAQAEGRTERERIDQERGVFMISVAAELAEMHPQTLRMYEARGLITPKRSPKNTRLYSQADVERCAGSSR